MKRLLIILTIAFALALPHLAHATVIFLTDTAVTTWTVPADWNNSNNSIEVIGGGAGGYTNAGMDYGAGGGGGAYSKISNLTLTPGASVTYAVGTGGPAKTDGGDTYFCNSTSDCTIITDLAVKVGAKAGHAATGSGQTGGIGGASASGIGTTKNSGGNGGNGFDDSGAGGGGAAGPNGNGAVGGANNASYGGAGGGGADNGQAGSVPSSGFAGVAGGNGRGGTGSGSGGASYSPGSPGTVGGGGGGGGYTGNGGAGGSDSEFGYVGSVGVGAGGGGGGGGAGSGTFSGGAGALYGGGGGGGGYTGGVGGAGAQGLIVITYTPSVSISVPTNFMGLNYGLVGWWTMDGKNLINNVTDSSGSGNNGFMQGFTSTSTATVEGKIGQALKFDGVDDVVTTPTDSLGTGDITVSAWINPASGTATDLPVFGNEKTFFMLQTNYDRLFISNNAGSDYMIISPIPFNTNRWTHIVEVRLSDGTVTVYANGAIIGGPSSAGVPVAGLTGTWIGANLYTGSFNGSIDDVRVYNRALSAAEVSQLYGVTSGGRANTTMVGPNNLNSGLVGWWTMDGKNLINNVTDSSGSGNNGFMQGFTSTSTAVVEGKIGQALKFDGSSSYVNVPDNPSLSPNEITVSAWIKPTALTNAYSAVVHKGDGTYFYELYVQNNGQLLAVVTGQYGAVRYAWGNYVLSPGNWYHVVLTYNRYFIYVYVNGNYDQGALADSYMNVINSSAPLSIGRDSFTAGTYFNGTIDDVRVYNRALSATEVKQLYSATAGGRVNTSLAGPNNLNSGLVGWWTMDGKDTNWSSAITGTTADKSGNNNTGTLTNMSQTTSPIEGKIGQALKFDGVGSYVKILGTANLNLASNFTISLWINPTANDGFVFSKDENVLRGYSLLFNSGWSATDWMIDGPNGTYYDTLVTRTINQWQHLVLVIDSSGTSGILYKNGVAGSPFSFPAYGGGGNADIYLGVEKYWNALQNYFNGTIDDVRVYNRALSAAEVKQLYNLGR